MGSGHIFERFERFFRLALLHEAHDGIQNDDKDDEGGLHELDGALLPRHEYLIADDAEGNARRDEQDDDHHVLELFKEADEHTLFLLLGELVLSVARSAGLRLLFGETLLRIRREVFYDLVLGATVKLLSLHSCCSPFSLFLFCDNHAEIFRGVSIGGASG